MYILCCSKCYGYQQYDTKTKASKDKVYYNQKENKKYFNHLNKECNHKFTIDCT